MRRIVLATCLVGGVILTAIFAEHVMSIFTPSDAKPKPGVLIVVTANVGLQALFYFCIVGVGVGVFDRTNLIPW